MHILIKDPAQRRGFLFSVSNHRWVVSVKKQKLLIVYQKLLQEITMRFLLALTVQVFTRQILSHPVHVLVFI
jgi:hypothetical protein